MVFIPAIVEAFGDQDHGIFLHFEGEEGRSEEAGGPGPQGEVQQILFEFVSDCAGSLFQEGAEWSEEAARGEGVETFHLDNAEQLLFRRIPTI